MAPTWQDLVDYARAQAAVPRAGAARNATVAWGAISRFVGNPQLARMPADQIVSELSDQRWKLEYNLNSSQKMALMSAVGQLRQAVDDPARMPARPGRTNDAALAAAVSRNATGSVIVHTSSHQGVRVTSLSGPTTTPFSGFSTFGDGAGERTQLRSLTEHLRDLPNLTEGVAFTPVMDDVLSQREVVTKQRRFGRDETAQRQVKTGERERLVPGPDGRPEPAVQFSYAYDPNQATAYRDDVPSYHDPASGRAGNQLIVGAVLPQSVADQLKTAIEQNPASARDVAERLVLERGGVDTDAWHGRGQYAGQPMRPPFEGTPATEPFHLVTAGQDGSPVVRTVDRAQQPAAGTGDLNELVNKYADPHRSGGQQHRSDGARPEHTRVDPRSHDTGRTGRRDGRS